MNIEILSTLFLKIHSKYECFSEIAFSAPIDGIQCYVLFSVCIYIVHMYYVLCVRHRL